MGKVLSPSLSLWKKKNSDAGIYIDEFDIIMNILMQFIGHWQSLYILDDHASWNYTNMNFTI